MLTSTASLQDLCVNYISNHLDILCERRMIDGGYYHAFKTYDGFLHRNVSQMLLEKLSAKRLINDRTLSLFYADNTRLERVQINNAELLTKEGLKYLRYHKISELEVTDLSKSITVSDLIGCLGEWTLNNLTFLNVSNNRFTNLSKFCVVVSLSKLKNLKTLIVQNTEFNDHGLQIVAEDLQHLENLDISSTRVSDLTPLKLKQNTLKSIKMYDLKLKDSKNFVPLICSMENLQHLDISLSRDDLFPVLEGHHFDIALFLESFTSLPKLISLDISGKDGIDTETLKIYLQNHSQLQFLGLFETDACADAMFTNNYHVDYNPNIYVTGNATESQIMQSLKFYPRRNRYIQKCLLNLYEVTLNHSELRMDLIELILPHMERFSQKPGIQLAASACLYNLIKGRKSNEIHKSCLETVVNLTLTAMQNFPKHQQIQKNGLLTLCSDLILQDVNFDKFLCARLVMESLVAFEDFVMNKMAVAICSILAAKISTEDTSTLGNLYMDRLLNIVQIKMDDLNLDTMFKFTLSTLWNLTDESPLTCSTFLQKGGLEVFLKVLDEFPGEYTVETKVLGLLNNISEVMELRTKLLNGRFLNHICDLLYSDNLDVSYFAAGILSHLCSDPKLDWSGLPPSLSKSNLLTSLGRVVEGWEFPESEMVTYRSFRPFYPLVACVEAQEVQQWALWAIYHVCSKNPSRYMDMLAEKSFLKYIVPLATEDTKLPFVMKLSRDILGFLTEHQKML